MASFADKRHGSTWFKRYFSACNTTHQAESNEIRKAFPTLKLLSKIMSSKKTQLGFVGYQPNLVARQFGRFQFKPNSYFQRKKGSCLSIIEMTEESYFEILVEQAENNLELTPFEFQSSFYLTWEFETWWKDYQTNKFVDVMAKANHLTAAFIFVQTKFKKRYEHAY